VTSCRLTPPAPAGYRCRALCSASNRRLQVPLLIRYEAAPFISLTLRSNLWGVFKDWWRHHGPLFSLSGENAFYQLWQQAVPRVTMVPQAKFGFLAQRLMHLPG
jgi:hypothetical protein